SPFGWSVAICALLISLPHLSQSVCRPGITKVDDCSMRAIFGGAKKTLNAHVLWVCTVN
ncbi:hypothetical protein L9F63_010561, partial [Diploptera punctata]